MYFLNERGMFMDAYLFELLREYQNSLVYRNHIKDCETEDPDFYFAYFDSNEQYVLHLENEIKILFGKEGLKSIAQTLLCAIQSEKSKEKRTSIHFSS